MKTIEGTELTNPKSQIFLICVSLVFIVACPVQETAQQIPPPQSFSKSGEDIRGIYFNSLQFAKREPEEIVTTLKENGFNAVVINVKNASGKLTYPSENELARKIGAVTPRLNPEEIITQFHQADIYVIARQVIFKDPELAEYLGGSGNWTNPGNEKAVTYNLNIAKEVSKFGFDEIQLDYVRYDDEGTIGGNYEERCKTITSFVKRTGEVLPSSINFSIDVYGRTIWKWNSKNKDPIGQNLDQLQPYVDYLSPMLYPSHYSQPSFVNNPYQCVSKGLKVGLNRLDGLRPFIQGFDRSVPPDMTLSEYIGNQIKAVHDRGLTSYLVWNPGADYEALWQALKEKR